MSHKSSNPNKNEWTEQQINYWNEIAENYDSLYQSKWSQAENNFVGDRLRNVLKDNDRVLDLACGTGLGYSICSSIVTSIEYVGLDISTQMLSKAKQNWVTTSGLVEPQFIEGEISDLRSFESQSFNVVMSLFMSFSYSYDYSRSIHEILRVLVPGGFIFISVLNRWSLRRLLRLKLGQYEAYKTRNYKGIAHSPAKLFSQHEVYTYFKNVKFQDISIEGYDLLAGVIENFRFWNTNLILSARMPFLCHSLILVAQKPIT